jgi:uncharacterized protein
MPTRAHPDVSGPPLRTTLTAARRLAVVRQRLTGKLPARVGRAEVLSVVRDLGYVQWDPVTTVAPSHLLSLWARLGNRFRPSDLEALLWTEKRLFLHWTPMASIVRTDDFPLYRSLMRRYPESLSRSWGSQREHARRFLADHAELRRSVLRELRRGPRSVGQFRGHAPPKRSDGGWTFGSEVAQMLYHLTMSGEVMVVGHEGNQNVWGLAEEFLPAEVDRTEYSTEEFERRAAERALRALGTATPREITQYFVRGRYERLRATLAELEQDGTSRRVAIQGMGDRDERYVHAQDVPLLGTYESSAPEPRVALVPPFDNLVFSPQRSLRLFDFAYVREQFLPKAKRTYGTYVLPLLWGDRPIGRIDPQMDRARRELVIHAVHAEPGAPSDRQTGVAIAERIAELGRFLGAQRVIYSSRVPAAWKNSLR